MKKFSLTTILTLKTPDLFWSLASFLKKQAKETAQEFIHDGKNYLLLEQPESPILFVAHIDTVNHEGCGPIELYVNDKGYIQNKHGILGADDRAGVYGILEIYRKCVKEGLEPPSLLFTNFEETPTKGVKSFCKDQELKYLDNYKMFIELDRKGNGSYVTYNGSLPKTVDTYLKDTAKLKEEHGSYSDVCDLTKTFKVPSINLACGFYKQHTSNELLDWGVLEKTITKCIEIYKDDTLPMERMKETERYSSTHHFNNRSYYDDDYYLDSISGQHINSLDSTNGKNSYCNSNRTVQNSKKFPNFRCPKCGYSEITIIGSHYSLPYKTNVDNYECNVCTHQFTAIDIDKEHDIIKSGKDLPSEYRPSTPFCEICDNSTWVELLSTTSSGTKTTFRCSKCNKKVKGEKLDIEKDKVCTHCSTNSMHLVDSYPIKKSENVHLEFTCFLCKKGTTKKIHYSLEKYYKGFNENVCSEVDRPKATGTTCPNCNSKAAFINTFGVGSCFDCNTTFSNDTSETKEKSNKTNKSMVLRKKDINKKIGKIPVEKTSAFIKELSKEFENDIRGLPFGTRKASKLINALQKACPRCPNLKNCKKAKKSIYLMNYYSENCPIFQAAEYTITAPEIFEQANIN